MKENIIETKSVNFAFKSIDLYKILKSKNEFVLSKQFLRSSTSIGANISESVSAASKKDFINKMTISVKEARETLYWLKLIQHYGLNDSLIHELKIDCFEIIKILNSIIKTSKENNNKIIHNS